MATQVRATVTLAGRQHLVYPPLRVGESCLNGETIKYLLKPIPKDSPLFLEVGDVLVQRSNTAELVGTTAVYQGPEATFIYPDLMMRLRFKRPVEGEWFWRYANSRMGRTFFRSIAAWIYRYYAKNQRRQAPRNVSTRFLRHLSWKPLPKR